MLDHHPLISVKRVSQAPRESSHDGITPPLRLHAIACGAGPSPRTACSRFWTVKVTATEPSSAGIRRRGLWGPSR